MSTKNIFAGFGVRSEFVNLIYTELMKRKFVSYADILAIYCGRPKGYYDRIACKSEPGYGELKKAFPDAHIEFNFNREAPAFLFRAIGRTKRCGGDEQNQSVGDAVARAKATARACVISKAIIKSAMSGLEEELKRNLRIFDEWREKERDIVKGV